MSRRSAIIFLPDDSPKTGNHMPLMLHMLAGAPLLKWLTSALAANQVGRFFLVCGSKHLQQAMACFPREAEVVSAQHENPGDLLHVFLSTADEEEEDLLVVTGPVAYVPSRANTDPGVAPKTANACMVSRQELMEALDGDFSFGLFLRNHSDVCTDREGFFSVNTPAELPLWQPILTRQQLSFLAEAGVEIWDYANCYVAPGIQVGLDTVLMPGTILRGDTCVGYGCVIGPNTQIIDSKIGNHATVDSSRLEGCQVGNNGQVGPFANLRWGAVVGSNAKVGAFVELKQASIGEGTQVAHLSYLGDCEVGAQANIGCGVVTANFDRAQKHRTVVEDGAFVGCNTSLIAPVTVGSGAYVAAGSTITENVPAQALAVARSRQQNRKEWALKNKKWEENK